MRRSRTFRLIALAFAVNGSLSAPVLALAHGSTHEHLVRHHDAHEVGHPHEGDHPVDAPQIDEAPESEHAHSHPQLEAATIGRDVSRQLAFVDAHAAVPALVNVRDVLLEDGYVAPSDLALAARASPSGAPPPSLRGPPVR